jgi:hypothetical protein
LRLRTCARWKSGQMSVACLWLGIRGDAIEIPDSIEVGFLGSRERSRHARSADWSASFRFVLIRELASISGSVFAFFADKFSRALLRLFVAKFEKS